MLLKDNIAVVIGGTGIIGRTICQKFAAAGAKVVIGFHQDEIKAVETLKLVENAGSTGNLYQIDVMKPDEINQLILDTCDTYQRIDTLIYATGGPLVLEDFLEMEAESWPANQNLTLTGFFHCAQAVIPQMRRQNYGRILALGGAGSGNLGAPPFISWDVAKTALVKLVKSLAVAEIQHGITLNIVNPSIVLPTIYFSAEEHSLIEEAFPEHAREALRQRIPAKRFATAEEITDVLLFLANPATGYVTGNTIDVTGGMGL